jgi:hypothetical protein
VVTSAPSDRLARLIAWLTRVALIIAALATASWGAGAHIAVRYLNPAAGVWWDAHEFALMQSAAAALGMLFGLRLGARNLAGASLQRRTVIAALVVGAILLPAVARLCSAAARLGWSGRGGALADWLVGATGYSAGEFIDKMIVAFVYSVKIVAAGLLVGLALAALGAAILMVADEAPANQS